MLIPPSKSHLSCFHHLAYVWTDPLHLYLILYCHILLIVHNLPIHYWAGSLLFSLSFLNCNDSTILLWTKKSPFTILHLSFSSFMNILLAADPPDVANSLSVGLILHNSPYLSCAFQLYEGFFRAGPPCLCQFSSVKFAVWARWDPASMPLNGIITAATWMATLFTTSEIPSDSAISAF